MPGVPSGKACEACRQLKKKCDQVQPACSRCVRLGLHCVGSGQRRFKFQAEQPAFAKRAQKHKSTNYPLVRRNGTGTLALIRPCSATESLAMSLVKVISPEADMRYSLTWYGGFLFEIPQRIGVNEALDTAVTSLLSAHTSFCFRERHSIVALTDYARALKALRLCLNDPVKAHESNTLCAVTLLLCCQYFLGTGGLTWTGHCEGATKLLKARTGYTGNDEFGRKVISTLRGPMLFEGLFNDSLDFDDADWATLEMTADNEHEETLLILPPLRLVLQRIRLNWQTGYDDITDIKKELWGLHETMKAVLASERDNLLQYELEYASTSNGIPPLNFTHCGLQGIYGVGLVIALICNMVANAMEPDSTELEAEAAHYVNEVLRLAQGAQQYTPMGSGYIVAGLAAAWAATRDKARRTQIRQVWGDFIWHCVPGWQEFPEADLERATRRLRLVDLADEYSGGSCVWEWGDGKSGSIFSTATPVSTDSEHLWLTD